MMRVVIKFSGLPLDHLNLDEPLLLGVLPIPRDTYAC